MNFTDISDFIIQSKLLNASFINAVLAGFGACFGAGVGAFLAQRLAGREKLKERLRDEVLKTNAAINLCISITNSAIGLKKQCIKPLWEAFAAKRAEAEVAYERVRRGELEQLFEYNADLQTINVPPLPAENLQDLVFIKIAASTKALTVVTTLRGSAHSLHEYIKARNRLVLGFIANNKVNEKEFPALYFGLKNRQGHVDATYASVMEAIYRGTDDCIFFSMVLQEELVKSGSAARALFLRKFGKNIPRILEPDFTLAANMGLLPDPKGFEQWSRMFVERQPEPSAWQKSKRWMRATASKLFWPEK